MLSIEFIRENAGKVKKDSADKGYEVDIDLVLGLDEERRSLQTQVEVLRTRRNEIASLTSGGKPTDKLIADGRKVKEELSGLEDELGKIEEKFLAELKKVPNTPLESVPVGSTEEGNVVVETIGEPPKFDFAPKNHWEIGQARGWIDKERAAKVAGARFAYIQEDLVRLEFALIQFVLDVLTSKEKLEEIISGAGLKDILAKPFRAVLPPLMIRTEVYDAMDRLEPREDRYKIEDEELWLQGSAEHVLGSMYMDEILAEKDLPIRLLGFAPSFRKEAGAAGKDMEGIFRMHQFDKLEMESLTVAEEGLSEHMFFVAIQKYLLKALDLPYRVLNKCTFDIGKPNASGYDMETWLPGQEKYKETHSADYMTDYQARRLKTRVRREDGKVELVHTNDATAFALGRIMIAIIENGQTKDGHVKVPIVLQKYMDGRETL